MAQFFPGSASTTHAIHPDGGDHGPSFRHAFRARAPRPRPVRSRRRADERRHRRVRDPVRHAELGPAELRAPRVHHPRLSRLRSSRGARSQDGQGRPESRHRVAEPRRHHLGGQAAPRREVPRRDSLYGAGREGVVRPRPRPREEADGARQPRPDQERRDPRRPQRPLQDRRPVPAFRRAAGRAGHAVREGNQGEGARVDAGEPDRHRPVQARQVDEKAGAPPRPQRRLLGAEARVQVRIRIIPEQATQLAELISGGVDVIKAVPPDQMDVINKSGAARTSTSPILRTAFLQLDQAARTGPNPFTDRRVRQAMNLAVDVDAIIKHVLNGLGDRTATTINPMAFGYDPTLKPYRQDVAAAKKLLADAGYPNGFEVGFLQGPPIVEPALPQTSEAIVSYLAKVEIRTRRRYVGEIGPYVNLVRDGKAEPMFEWSWGYYSVFDADAILYDLMKCGEAYSYYCNKALDDLIIQGRSTLDQKKRAEIYVKIQRLIFEDAAYLFKWGLRGVWGIANRLEYQAPRDEIDRMFLVTPRTR